MDRPSPSFLINEPFHIKYLIKIQPLTRGDYVFKVSPPAEFKICKLIITHVGENMPCVQQPSASTTGAENTQIKYSPSQPEQAKECGADAEIAFKVRNEVDMTE